LEKYHLSSFLNWITISGDWRDARFGHRLVQAFVSCFVNDSSHLPDIKLPVPRTSTNMATSAVAYVLNTFEQVLVDFSPSLRRDDVLILSPKRARLALF
jgi:hypothetical protein